MGHQSEIFTYLHIQCIHKMLYKYMYVHNLGWWYCKHGAPKIVFVSSQYVHVFTDQPLLVEQS